MSNEVICFLFCGVFMLFMLMKPTEEVKSVRPAVIVIAVICIMWSVVLWCENHGYLPLQ